MIVSPVASRAFVGRDAELAELHERRRKLAQRQGSTVLVGGPAGMGKSRLLTEFCSTIGGGRAPLLVRTECAEAGGIAFGPIREIVDAAATVSGEPGFDELARGALEQTAFFRALERTVREAAARRAIVACIEDLHWADPATLEFLIAFAAKIPTERVLIVGTYRDDEIAARSALRDPFARLFRAASVHRFILEPIPDAAMFALLESAGEGRPELDPSLRDSIARRAEGNPFYAEELLKSALEGGAQETVPFSIAAAIAARFEALPAGDRRVLEMAAILGYRFDPVRLAEMTGEERGTIATALRNARASNLVIEDRERGGEVRFRHALVHDAIANGMLDYEARALHAHVARLIEGRARAAETAYHWWKARDREHGGSANEAAGDEAMAVHAYGDAAILFERALELTADAKLRAHRSIRLAGALSSAGDHLRAARAIDRCIHDLIDAGEFDTAGNFTCAVAGRLAYAGDDLAARQRIDAFAATYGARLSAGNAAIVWGWPIWLDPGNGRSHEWSDAFGTAGAGGSEPDVVRVERWIGVVAAAATGDWDAWTRNVELLERTPQPDPRLENLALAAIAETAALAERPEAPARIAALHAHCRRHALEKARGKAHVADAHAALLHGDLAAARRALLAAAAVEDRACEGALLALAPLAGLELDDAALLAVGDDPQLAQKLERRTFHHAGVRAAGAAARALAAGNARAARDWLERGVAALHTSYGAHAALVLAARYVEDRDARARTIALCDSAPPGDAAARAMRAMVRALFAARDADEDRRELARAAAEEYRSLRRPLFEAHALELAGERDAALALFERCGAVRGVRRLQRTRPSAASASGGAPPQTAAPPELLTPRERDVALGVASGLGNAEIAARLGLSVKTIESHLSRIYARLGYRSRAQLAAFVAARGLEAR